MKNNFYIRIGESSYKNLNEYSDSERKLIAKRLNEQAAQAIVIKPKTA